MKVAPHLVLLLTASLLCGASLQGQTDSSAQSFKVSLIYSSDLYWPPDDPDDYFDLATLFSIPEIDVLGILLDQQVYDRHPEREGTGAVPLRQIFSITGRSAPFAVGLRAPLQSKDDRGLDQDSACQKGVEMILGLVERARNPVVLLAVGTLRDIAAAYNRNPDLFHRKISRVYVNAGIYGFPHDRFDVNLDKDRNAFVAIMTSGLPVYWASCFGEDNHETYWQVGQRTLLEGAPQVVQNFFLFAFSKGGKTLNPAGFPNVADTVAFLRRPINREELERVYAETRNMWSTVTFLDAAGLNIYTNGRDEYTASLRPAGEFTREVRPYSFSRVKVSIDTQGRILPGSPGNTVVYVLHKDDPELYRKALEGVLKRRFSDF